MAEGKDIQIPFLGIVRNTPGTLGRDGEAEEMINLRFKDGALRPIPLRSDFATVTGYADIYIHSNAGYKHVLGVDTAKLYYIGDIVSGNYVPKVTRELVCAVSGSPTYTQIGNVINILDSTGIKHAIWYTGVYRFISNAYDGDQTSITLPPVGRIDLRVTGIVNGSNVREARQYYGDNYTISSGLNQKEQAKAAVKGLISRALFTEAKDGRLMGFFLACTAVELYDGSYILQSNPVLMGQPWDAGSRYKGLQTVFNYDSNPIAFGMGTGDDIFMKTDGAYNTSDKYYVRHVNNAYPHNANTRYAATQYPNMLPMLPYRYGATAYPLHAVVGANKLQVKVNQTAPTNLSTLIKSVSVFITREVSAFDLEGDLTERELGYDFTGQANLFSYQWLPKPKTDEKIIEELMSQPVFYKVHEIPFEDLVNSGWEDINLTGKLGDLLPTREVLPIDPFSHHTLKPQYQYVYNSRLHVANYNNVLSRGWPLNNFNYLLTQGTGQFTPAEYLDVSDAAHYIEVLLKTDMGESKVVRYQSRTQEIEINLMPLISYPDRRATKITFYFWFPSTLKEMVIVRELAPSDFHNFAYYISPDLKTSPFPALINAPTAEPPPIEFQRELPYTGVFRASEINNPFTFPAANTYQVGSGTILAMASNAQALSTGQFGEYPLLVFCSDGIHAMYLGGGGVTYAASRPVSRDVCSNPASVKTVDGGVVFTTSRGLMVISGAQVSEISDPVEGGHLTFLNSQTNPYILIMAQALNHASLVQLQRFITGEDFTQYIQNAIIAYNHKERELWVINPQKTYSYIYASGVWSKVADVCSAIVEDYPLTYLHKTGKLISVESEANTAVPTMLLTRPIKLGTRDFKTTYRAVLRGLLEVSQNKYAGFYVFGSYDGIKWAFLGGTESPGTIRDIGTTIERVDCKYFRIGFVGELSINSSLEYLEISARAKLTGKLR